MILVGTDAALQAILNGQDETKELLMAIQEQLNALNDEVAGMGNVVEGANRLLDRILDEIEAAKDDPAQVQEAIDAVRAQRESLAASVARGTASESDTGGGGDTGGDDTGGGEPAQPSARGRR